MIEAAAEANEELTNKYLERRGRSPRRRSARVCARARSRTRSCWSCAAPRSRTRACRRCSMRSSSSCPRRSRCRPSRARTARGEPDTRKASDDEPFAALAFKILNDPFVGNLTFFRVYSGTLNSGDTVYVPTKDKKERIGRLLQMHASERTEIKEVRAGDIAAAVGLKDVITGDTLCDLEKVITLEKMVFPEPGHRGGGRAEDQGGPGEDGPGAAASREGRPVVPHDARTRSPARRSSPAWASCTSRSSSTA